MGNHDMDHMEFLDRIADGDVQHLNVKESTYKGSWKRRGGVGAFMMLARKWDRIEPMAEGSGYDIFALIEQQGLEGADGTLIAEIRDLRRYLLLVEAEVLSRALKGIDVERPVVPRVHGGPVAQSHETRGAGPADRRPPQESLDQVAAKNAAEQRALVVNRLEDGVATEDQPNGRLDRFIFVPDSGVVIVDRRKVEPGEVDHLPRLQIELNNFEWQMTPFYYRFLYGWYSSCNKHILKEEYVEAWGQQP